MEQRRGSSQESGPKTAFDSSTFDKDVQIRLDETVGAASISPSGRDVVLASREGLHIIDLDSPFSLPRYVPHRSPWEVADVQWSPFASRDSWIVSTSNQKALVWNLNLSTPSAPIEHTLHAHSNAITDINFSAHHADILATCAVDSYVHCWDLRKPSRPVISFAEWFSGATQVKWNRQDSHIIASSHQRKLLIWDDRKGAYPLKEIEAHSTQIYGIDWNRVRPEAVLTCSLDRTIKLWDYTKEDNVPERVIRTPYPIWRARHTPFGWGVLAMPKRHDFNLHLYNRHTSEGEPFRKDLPPVHSFDGHTDQVKEFLWRSRGDIQDSVDQREFQLVSWGADRVLRLHKIGDDQLEAVGHHRGGTEKRLKSTRSGSIYRTFRDETPKLDTTCLPTALRPPRASGLLGWSLTQGAMGKSAALSSTAAAAPAGMQARRRAKKAENAIDWMGGVKMGKAAEGGLLGLAARNSIRHSDHQVIWDTPDSLSDEITYVGKNFKKVNFEHVDVNKRLATVTLNGPWGPEGASAFIRLTLKFPSTYPVHAVPQYMFERTTSAIANDALAKIKHGLRTITEDFGMRRIGSLEAIIMYLLGERGLEDILKVFTDPIAAEDSSSDDDDDDDDGTGRLDLSGSLGSAVANASAPLPKACGAYFAEDGRLVCFFPPKPEPKPLFDLGALRADDKPKSHRLFDDLGRWRTESPEPKDIFSDLDTTEEEDDNSSDVSSSSSASSSDTSDIISGLTGRFKPPAAWRGATLRLQKTSQHSSSGQIPPPKTPPPPKSYISIVDTRDLLPAKKELAEDYIIYGDGSSVCSANAAVALQNNLPDLAQVWELMRMILFNQVPLEIMQQTHRKDHILVAARRAVAFRKKKESAVDLAGDEDDGLYGRVKWGGHPMAGRWLIPKLFEHFERLADTQMLAMMSCIFAEPPATQSMTTTLMRLKQQDLSMPMKCPTFSLDYFASEETAWSMFHQQTERVTIMHPDLPSVSWSEDGQIRYGSGGSSNGVWSNDDRFLGGPNVAYSAQSTPPKLSRASAIRLNYPNSLSTSPEKNLAMRRASANPSMASQAIPRTYTNTALGIPPELRFNDDEATLSTSAPTSTVTWGGTTVFNTGSHSPTSYRKSRAPSTVDGSFDMLNHLESDDSSLSSDDDQIDSRSFISRRSFARPSAPSTDVTIKVTLKNQDLFDDEAHASVPFLDPADAAKYAAYRVAYAEQLAVWGLAIQHSEILKFNGLMTYGIDEYVRGGHHSRNSSKGTQRSGNGIFKQASKLSKSDAHGQHCRICWQLVDGLCVACKDCGIGVAHQECINTLAGEEVEDVDWCNISVR